jgi:hypothetical protein
LLGCSGIAFAAPGAAPEVPFMASVPLASGGEAPFATGGAFIADGAGMNGGVLAPLGPDGSADDAHASTQHPSAPQLDNARICLRYPRRTRTTTGPTTIERAAPQMRSWRRGRGELARDGEPCRIRSFQPWSILRSRRASVAAQRPK